MDALHVSVLLHECIENLNIRPDGIYVDGTRVCSGVILPDDAFDPWLTMQADTDPFWIAADGSTLVLPLPGMQSLVVAPAESEQAAQELLLSLQEALPDETKNAISHYLK